MNKQEFKAGLKEDPLKVPRHVSTDGSFIPPPLNIRGLRFQSSHVGFGNIVRNRQSLYTYGYKRYPSKCPRCGSAQHNPIGGVRRVSADPSIIMHFCGVCEADLVAVTVDKYMTVVAEESNWFMRLLRRWGCYFENWLRALGGVK